MLWTSGSTSLSGALSFMASVVMHLLPKALLRRAPLDAIAIDVQARCMAAAAAAAVTSATFTPVALEATSA
eukprot:CAMPEP_0172865048 /NCGR_PEP_ID=MMETSP1075-20121228/81182_1 /TAXON_ID=2916 /ORGANISM="Ceratium fusus, Strain PA161109" /LENGTH=70 /DNA_ID=CAMNT_0013714035 /DNA_START=58 /DNA_END=266 /DNA_ORIENTATION=+